MWRKQETAGVWRKQGAAGVWRKQGEAGVWRKVEAAGVWGKRRQQVCGGGLAADVHKLMVMLKAHIVFLACQRGVSVKATVDKCQRSHAWAGEKGVRLIL